MMNAERYSLIKNCRLCQKDRLSGVYNLGDIPVAGIYYDDNSARLNIKTPVTLMICNDCGLLQLKETINSEIYAGYSFIGGSAFSYKQHLKTLASTLVNKWNVKNKKVFEIGASNGVFLKYLSEVGNNYVSGIEPSGQLCNDASKEGIYIKNGYFSTDYVKKNNIGKFDCVIIRHVLEHIDNLNDMIIAIKNIITESSIVVVEVPDINKIISTKNYTNIFHEHLNYFSPNLLNKLMSNHELGNIEMSEVDIHGGAILGIYKIGNKDVEFDKTERVLNVAKKAKDCFNNAGKYYSYINQKITGWNKSGRIVHGYGASHRTFIFLGNANIDNTNIPIIYDNNKFLQNKRLNGFHSLIMSPEFILKNNPDVIVVFATSYQNEITQYLKEDLGFKGEVFSLKEKD